MIVWFLAVILVDMLKWTGMIGVRGAVMRWCEKSSVRVMVKAREVVVENMLIST